MGLKKNSFRFGAVAAVILAVVVIGDHIEFLSVVSKQN